MQRRTRCRYCLTDGKAEHDVPYPAWPKRSGTVVAALVVARIALTTAVMPTRAAAPVQVPLAMTAVSLAVVTADR